LSIENGVTKRNKNGKVLGCGTHPDMESFHHPSGKPLDFQTVPLTALSGNPVISVMVSWMCNNAKDAKIEIDNTLRVSAPLRLSR